MKTRNSKASKVKLASLAIGVFFCTIYFISGSLINKAWTASTTTTTGETTKEQKVSNRITGVKWQAQYRLDENKDSYLQERFDFADELLQQNSVTDVTYEFDGNGDGNSDEKKGIEKWYVPRKKGSVSCLRIDFSVHHSHHHHDFWIEKYTYKTILVLGSYTQLRLMSQVRNYHQTNAHRSFPTM